MIRSSQEFSPQKATSRNYFSSANITTERFVDGDDEKKRRLKPPNSNLLGINMLQVPRCPASTEDETRKQVERVSARTKEQQDSISKVAVVECQDLLKRLFDTLAEEEDELEQLRTQVAEVTERRNGISAQIDSSQNRLLQLRDNHSVSLATKSELREAVRNWKRHMLYVCDMLYVCYMSSARGGS